MNEKLDCATPRFTVLDNVRAWRGDQELALGTPQERLVLAILLFSKGSTVSTSSIIDLVWDTDPPQSALGAVRTYISRLRRTLQPEGHPQLLIRRNQGYALQVPPESVDLHRFDALVARSRSARADGDHESAARLLREGLRLWGPEPLAGLPGDFAETRREQLTERRISAMEARFDSELELGREAETLGELRPVAEAHPLRERLQGHLMVALARAGRQSGALDVFTRTRLLLTEDLGVDPGTELQELHSRVLTGEIGPAAGPPRPMQLPAEPVGFVGRADDVRSIDDACDTPERSPVVLLTGIGGGGKTALAVRAGHRLSARFGDGQLYVNLHGVGPDPPAEPEAVLRSFLRALGVRTDDLPEALEECAARYRSTLASRRVLVVLDNAASADQVLPLLPGDAGSATIVTSRHRLPELPVARTIEIGGLPSEEANVLLSGLIGADRAAAEPEAVASLATVGDGLPLAVRILGSRLAARPQWRAADLAARLADQRDRLDELSAGDLDVAAAFRLSYGQLDAREAEAFRLLGLCAEGAFDTRLAAAVLGRQDPAEAEADCERLADAGLLQSPAPATYAYHDLVRLFAVRRIERDEPTQGRRDAVRRALRACVAALRRGLAEVDPQESLIRQVHHADDDPELLRAEDDPRTWAEEHIDALLRPCRLAGEEFADGEEELPLLAVDVVTLLFCLLDSDVVRENLARVAERLAEAGARSGHSRVRHRARGVLGAILVHVGSMTEAISVLQDAREHLAGAGDLYPRARCEFFLADVLLHLKRPDESLRIAGSAAEGFEALDERYEQAAAIGQVTRALGQLGRYVEADTEGRRAVELFRELGALEGEAFAWFSLGVAHYRAGALTDALSDLRTSQELRERVGNRLLGSFSAVLEAEVHLAVPDGGAAAEAARRAYDVAREFGHKPGIERALTALGHAARMAGDVDAARLHWEEALEVLLAIDSPDAEGLRELLAGL